MQLEPPKTIATYFRKRSGNVWGTPGERSGNVRGPFRERLGTIQGTFGEHFGNVRGTSGRVEADARRPPSQLQEVLQKSSKVSAEYNSPT
jgi:hypothetical protein